MAASSDRQRLGTGETTRLGPRADDGGGAPGADSPAGARTRAVLLAQSAAARGALDTLAALGADGGVRPDGPILIVGSGSSYYLALTAAFVGRAAGLRVEAAPSCEVLLYPDAYLAQRPTLAVVSRSGETSEAVAAASAARARDLATVAVTAAPTSALSLAAGRVLAVPGGQDGTLVMLRSFTGMLVLVLAWLRGQAALAPLAAVAQAEDAWAATVLAATDAALVAPPRHLVVLGGGARYGIARETVLKAEEMALVRGEAYHPLEYRHGPRAALGADDLVLLYSDPEHVAEEAPLADELVALGARVWVVSSRAAAWPGRGQRVLALPAVASADPDLMTPLMAIAGQALAWTLAVRRGVDPDAPPQLTDVVVLPEA